MLGLVGVLRQGEKLLSVPAMPTQTMATGGDASPEEAMIETAH